jgi:hypothetical protein
LVAAVAGVEAAEIATVDELVEVAEWTAVLVTVLDELLFDLSFVTVEEGGIPAEAAVVTAFTATVERGNIVGAAVADVAIPRGGFVVAAEEREGSE